MDFIQTTWSAFAESSHKEQRGTVNYVINKPNTKKFNFSFNINFQTQNDYNTSDIILHVSVRVAEGVIIFNTKDSGKWLSEQKGNTLAIGVGKEFEILVACEANQFRVSNYLNSFSMQMQWGRL